jgi:hypothetical protein
MALAAVKDDNGNELTVTVSLAGVTLAVGELPEQAPMNDDVAGDAPLANP